MNWFVILPLSLFWAMTGWSTTFLQLPTIDWGYWGVIVVIGVLSIFGFSTGPEMVIWVLLLCLSALLLAIFTHRRWFRHGFWVGLIGGGIAAYLQLTFLAQYSEIFPDGADWLTNHVPIDVHPFMTQIHIAVAVGSLPSWPALLTEQNLSHNQLARRRSRGEFVTNFFV